MTDFLTLLCELVSTDFNVEEKSGNFKEIFMALCFSVQGETASRFESWDEFQTRPERLKSSRLMLKNSNSKESHTLPKNLKGDRLDWKHVFF